MEFSYNASLLVSSFLSNLALPTDLIAASQLVFSSGDVFAVLSLDFRDGGAIDFFSFSFFTDRLFRARISLSSSRDSPRPGCGQASSDDQFLASPSFLCLRRFRAVGPFFFSDVPVTVSSAIGSFLLLFYALFQSETVLPSTSARYQ